MANYRQLEKGFFIGTQPTEQDLDEAKQMGIKTVIDLDCRIERYHCHLIGVLLVGQEAV